MTSALQNQFFASAWACSLTLHGVVVGLALLFAAQMKPVLEENVFSWEVALVQEARIELASLPPGPAVKPAPPARQITPPQPVEPPSDMVMTPVAPRQSVEMVHPVVEPPKPVEQKVETPPQKVEPVERKVEAPQPTVEKPKVEPIQEKVVVAAQPKAAPVEQKVVEVEKPKVEPVQEKVIVAERPRVQPVQQVVEARPAAPSMTPEPIIPQTPVVAMAVPVEPVFNPSLAANTYEPPKYSGSSSSEAVAESGGAPSLEDMAPIRPSLVPVGEASATAAVKPSATPSAQSADGPRAIAAVPSQTDTNVSAPANGTVSNQEARGDHKWLAESLWRRVAELKRYPTSARLNGLEGKVVLKAVIRSDGQLAEVTVQKSSGHNVLDAAAMEAVKLACPLYMKHAIGKPLIVVSLPIVYSLAN